MKTFGIVIFWILIGYLFAQGVVINEVLYDPDGSDSGYEWIELYNNSDQSVNLNGWMIRKAGSQFELVYAFDLFSGYTIPSHSYFLIGEEFVPDTDLTTSLAFQNGGSETDGIRLISADGLYTDTILYDSPNANELPDDISNPGEYFAPDVSDGNTLARKHDGEDSNNCEIDFFECEDPTPGEANFYPIDIAIYNFEIYENDGEYWLQIVIENLSTENVDNLAASINIAVNDTLIGTYGLPAIPAESTIDFSCQIGELANGYHQIAIELIYIYDNELENNYVENSILNGASPFVLNEIMFKPLSTNQEWVEIFNRTECGYSVYNLMITDASGSIISFDAEIPSQNYIVVCQDTILFLQTYPEVDPQKVIFASDWASLNNTEETLILSDEFETKLDSTSYNGNSCPSDFSIERIDPFDDENILWSICTDSLGTPTLPNSVLFLVFADFEAMPTIGSAPLDVQFTDLSTGGLPAIISESKNLDYLKIAENDNLRDIISWEWDFDNDGFVDSNEQNPIHNYDEEGVYTVSLTVSNGTNTETEIKVDYIIVNSVSGDIGLLPINTKLYQNNPNPFNPTTTIEFSINNNSIVELSIYNIKGQKIKTLANNDFIKGNHSIIWNGVDKLDKPVSSGIYYYKLNVNGKTEAVKKCLLLK